MNSSTRELERLSELNIQIVSLLHLVIATCWEQQLVADDDGMTKRTVVVCTSLCPAAHGRINCVWLDR